MMDPTLASTMYSSIFISKITNNSPSTIGSGPYEDNTFSGPTSNPVLNNQSLPENLTNCSFEKGSPMLPWNVLTTVFYAVVILLGVVGNALVISTVVRRSDIRSPCNLLLANIAAADFAVVVFPTPVRILELYFGWPLGKWGCHILFPIQDVLVTVSVVTHTAIALERHRALTCPFKLKLSRKKVKQILLSIWATCYTLIGLPQSVFSRFAKWRGKSYCWPQWPNWPSTAKDFRVGYEIFLVSVFIAVPLLIQTFSYTKVIRILKVKNKLGRIHYRCDSYETGFSMRCSQYKERIRKKRKLVRMLVVLVALFQVCYIPRGAAMLLCEFVPGLHHSSAFSNIDRVIMILYYIKHVVNPVILWFMSRDFHSSFLSVAACARFPRRR